MATGTVKWLNEQKRYGFIQPDQGGRDVFVHISAVERSGLSGLAEGLKVSYEVLADRRTVDRQHPAEVCLYEHADGVTAQFGRQFS